MSEPFVIEGDSRDREVWLRARRTGVGASEAAVIVGESRYQSAAMLFAAKTREEPEHDAEPTPEYFAWGLLHEPTILAAYSSERYAHRPARAAGLLLRSIDHPWALATLDAWTDHPEHGDIPLELKTAEVFKADEWSDGAPREYFWQVQQQMLVTGRPYGSIACLLGVHRLVWDDVPRDDAAIERLVRAGERFWKRVETGECPPGPLDAQSLRTLYPRDDGNTIELPGTMIELDDERVALLERRRWMDKRIEELDSAFRGAIGPAKAGVLPSGVTYALRTEQRKAYQVNVEARQLRTLRRKAAPKDEVRT